MTDSFWDHPIETLEKALHLRKKIEALKAELTRIYGNGRQPLASEKPIQAKRRGRPPKTALVELGAGKVDGRKGKRSAATIAKMKAAQKARWAKKGVSTKSAKLAPTKKRRKFSAASRAKMAAAAKARWAKKKIDADVTMPDKLIW